VSIIGHSCSHGNAFGSDQSWFNIIKQNKKAIFFSNRGNSVSLCGQCCEILEVMSQWEKEPRMMPEESVEGEGVKDEVKA
jgi:hypothetical protein